MLSHLQTHAEYVQLSQAAWKAIPIDFQRPYQTTFDLFQHLNFDPIHSLIQPLYATTGRPALYQIESLRALILSVSLKIPFPQLSQQLKLHRPFWTIAGFPDASSVPSLGSFYHLMQRYCPVKESKVIVSPPKKLNVKLGTDKKLPSRKKQATQQVIDHLKRHSDKPHFVSGPEKTLQRLFDILAVQQSKAIGLLANQLIASGDGTCIPSHATPYVRKSCHCSNPNKKSCPHEGILTDPNARWGYDSSKGTYFYGYTGYFLATYQADVKCDLPLYFRLVEAQRHDSVSAVIALHEFNYLSPHTSLTHFLGDSAHDNYAFYQWLDTKDILPIIKLNQKKKGRRELGKVEITYAPDGTPICLGEPMVYNGYSNDRCRHKWRCAICYSKKRRLENPNHYCSDSPYGRVVYTKCHDDLRLYPKVARQSNSWTRLYSQRPAVERINKTLMIDDALETTRLRSQSRIYWHIFASFVLIHLKAQVAFTAR